MILNDLAIKTLCVNTDIPLITPFHPCKVEKGQNVRMSYGLEPQGYTLTNDRKNDLILEPLTGIQLISVETVNLPANICAFFKGKSSYTRFGCIFSTATVDAGYHGKLSFFVFNAGADAVEIVANEGIVQISFFELSADAAQSYNGFWQNHGLLGK